MLPIRDHESLLDLEHKGYLHSEKLRPNPLHDSTFSYWHGLKKPESSMRETVFIKFKSSF